MPLNSSYYWIYPQITLIIGLTGGKQLLASSFRLLVWLSAACTHDEPVSIVLREAQLICKHSEFISIQIQNEAAVR
jgi:hypothetical protein